MQLLPDLSLQAKMLRWSRYLAAVVVIIASLVMAGWQFGVNRLIHPLPGLVAMNPLTALSFILSGVSFILISSSEQPKIKRSVAIILAITIFLIASVKLISLFTGNNWHIDRLLFTEKLQKDMVGIISNSMAPNTAFCFILTGLSLGLYRFENARKKNPVQFIALIIALTAWLSILGYIYQVQAFYGILSYTPMAFHTAICFLCISLAMLFAQSGKGIMKQFTSKSAGSVTARLLVPAAVLVPSFIGLFRLPGYWVGIYSTELGVALYTLSIIIIFLVLAWYVASILNKRDILKNEAEEALRSSQEEIAAIFNAAPDAIIVIDGQSRIVKWNPQAETLFGWTTEEITGKQLTETIIPAPYRKSHKKGMQHFLSTGQSGITGKTVEISAINKNNVEFDIALRIAPVSIKGSYLFVGFVRDITEKKKTEQKIKSFNEELSRQVEEKTKEISEAKKLSDKLIDSIPGIFYFYDQNGRFIRWNKQFETVTGYSAEEIALMHPVDFFEGKERSYITEKIREVFVKGVNDAETSFLTKTGDKIPYYFKAVLINYEGAPCLLGSGIDITERKKAENEMLRLNEELRKLTGYLQKIREEERTHIAREIHDELGQQLTVMKMDLAWLNKKTATRDEAVKEKMTGVLSMIDTTVRTVRRIAAELRPSLLDDLGLIPAMEWHLEEFEKRSGVHTSFNGPKYDRQLPDDIKIGLFRILQESLTNIARHANAKKVKVSLEQNEKEVILNIADDGIGFEGKSTSKKTLGILGMKERTLMLGGKYMITSVPGKGTEVFVSIPVDNAGN